MPDDYFSPWIWAGFVLLVVAFLALDLGLFHRKPRPVSFKQALAWSVVWFLVAMAFAATLAIWRGPEQSLEFVAGYLVEYSLSLDNVFAISVIFTYFAVPAELQHRVLFWGILGALVMRGLMIGAGVELLDNFHWLFYAMGAFLLWTGIKWGFTKDALIEPEKNNVVRLARKFFPVTSDFHGQKFFASVAGRRALTPLALALITVEVTDVLFATDSIPAIFAVTQNAFIVFTSNICAILGLRSLYFVLAGAMHLFRFLKTGLAVVLVFIGAKMLASDWFRVPTAVTLVVVAAIIAISILVSILKPAAPDAGKK